MYLQAWETVEVEAPSAMQLNAEHRSGSGVLSLVMIMLRNSVDVVYRDGIVKLLRVNMDGKNDTVVAVTAFATNELQSRVVSVQTHVDPKAITIARKSDVLKIWCVRGSSFVATDENDTQLEYLTPVLCMARNPSNAVIFAGHSSGMLTMWTSNMPSPAVALVAHSGLITAVAVTESGKYATTYGVDETLLLVEEFGVNATPTEPHTGDGIAEEPHDCVEKVDVDDVGKIGRIVAVVWNVKRGNLTPPTSRAVPGLSSRTSDDASPETAEEPIIGSFFAFHETISWRSIIIDWNHIFIGRICKRMN